MSSACKRAGLVLFCAGLACGADLRVCADPNNMPYSNQSQQGFENKLAQLVSRSMDRNLQYVWWPQRQSFLRYTLLARRCDVVMGVTPGSDNMQTTRPYYRSSFVFVARRDLAPPLHSLDDPRLRHLRIGLHVVGEDYSSVPPGQGLALRGITGNIAGYPIYGDYSGANPRAPLIDAVAGNRVDVAIVWGPLAGYFARNENPPLRITSLIGTSRDRLLPYSIDIAMGVREGDDALRKQLDAVIVRRGPEIRSLLQSYGVPVAERSGQ